METIERARDEVYCYYEGILKGTLSEKVSEDTRRKLRWLGHEPEFVFWEGRIVDDCYRGEDFFLGKVLDGTKMTASCSQKEYGLIVAQSSLGNFEGIDTFEDYSERSERLLMRVERGIVVQGNSLNEVVLNQDLMRRVRYLIDNVSRVKAKKG
jgi:hypothetical protein